LAALASIRAMLTYLRDHPTEAQIEAMAKSMDEMAWIKASPPAMMPMEGMLRRSKSLGRARAAHRALFDAILRETTDGN